MYYAMVMRRVPRPFEPWVTPTRANWTPAELKAGKCERTEPSEFESAAFLWMMLGWAKEQKGSTATLLLVTDLMRALDPDLDGKFDFQDGDCLGLTPTEHTQLKAIVDEYPWPGYHPLFGDLVRDIQNATERTGELVRYPTTLKDPVTEDAADA